MALQHETALVVGASGGIGRAVAVALAQAGARVALVGRDRAKLESTAAALPSTAPERGPMVAPCDTTSRPTVATMVEAVLAELGSIDILVCASGLNIRQRGLRSIDPADWDRVIDANLNSAFNLIHYVVPSMRVRGNGLVIQLSSLAGMRPSTVAGAAYSASKFGQAALGVVLAREERGRGIRSTVIYPGEVDTPFLDVRAARPGGAEGSVPRREGILQPADVAQAVLFLAELPARAHIPELVIKPTIDDFS
ncbi:MAG TPA: SDR family NAD(P)-dependent oxidoreductase [Polyangia bacterium]|jgi:NADP-dependent 3-hydroxy acid dehydrogenase YdfG|nr:SDR family NAD(P)-dependent oxidoreductase [Polyangia bacterium]